MVLLDSVLVYVLMISGINLNTVIFEINSIDKIKSVSNTTVTVYD